MKKHKPSLCAQICTANSVHKENLLTVRRLVSNLEANLLRRAYPRKNEHKCSYQAPTKHSTQLDMSTCPGLAAFKCSRLPSTMAETHESL